MASDPLAGQPPRLGTKVVSLVTRLRAAHAIKTPLWRWNGINENRRAVGRGDGSDLRPTGAEGCSRVHRVVLADIGSEAQFKAIADARQGRKPGRGGGDAELDQTFTDV